MNEEYLYWDSGAMLCRAILAHIWLGLVPALVRKTWRPVVCRSEPLSSQMRAENRRKEEYGPYLAWRR